MEKRVSLYERYYYITDIGLIGTEIESFYLADNCRYECGNYFRTMEDAVSSELFKYFHKDCNVDSETATIEDVYLSVLKGLNINDGDEVNANTGENLWIPGNVVGYNRAGLFIIQSQEYGNMTVKHLNDSDYVSPCTFIEPNMRFIYAERITNGEVR